MSEKLPGSENKTATDETAKDYQRNKGQTKIPGTAVFRSPYSVASKTASCSPYYIMSSTGGVPAANASDEDKRRIMHNEVERKRKEKINKWIVRLCQLVPDCNGKLSKNCVLEKTVNFIQQLTMENELPDDVQALKTEVIRLTERVESLSSENTHYLSLLKEAQNLSKGAWSLNMSIQRHKYDSSGGEMEDGSTTMTPTLDRVNTATGSNLTQIVSAPNLPGLTGNPGHVTTAQNIITLPIVAATGPLQSAAPSGQTVVGQTVVSAQPIQVTPSLLQLSNVTNTAPEQTQVKAHASSSTKIGSMVTAMSGNTPGTIFTNSQPVVHQPPTSVTSIPLGNGQTFVASPDANGHTFLANGHPVIANVQDTLTHTLKNNMTAQTGASHSIQALLRGETPAHGDPVSTATGNKTLYSIPTYLQTVQNGAGTSLYMAQNTPLVAAQPPLLVHGENGPVVIMTPRSLPYYALPLNTMSSNQVMCEPTASSRGPLVVNQFPSLLNYTEKNSGPNTPVAQQPQNTVQIGSLIQGPQGQQSVVVGTQPLMTTQAMMTPQPATVQVMQGAQGSVIGTMGLTQATQQPTMHVQQPTMLQTQTANLSAMMSGAPTVLQVVNQNGREHVTGQAAQLIQVPNSEGQQHTAMLIPQSTAVNGQPTQCFIPVEVTLPVPVPTVGPTVVTVAPQVSLTNTLVTQDSNKNVTDFSISETYHGVVNSAVAKGTTDLDETEEADLYLSTNTSDSSFSSDCFTPPYTSSGNLLLSSANVQSLSPGEGSSENNETKPLSHSIASLTGMNNN